MKYQCPQTGKTRTIFLLDSEGIQSAEARDQDFDKRIVCFLLSVSHVVLLCNKQELSHQMAEVLKLVVDAMMETDHQVVSNPSVYIILNMLAQIESNTLTHCVNQV